LKNPFTKIGLVKWLKVKALSSTPVPQKQQKKKKKRERERTKAKRVGGTTQVVKCLLSKLKALNSNPNTDKKKKR
jgi:hypothetical protein